MNAFEMLAGETYMIEHSPNCPMPYLVRVVTPGTGSLDRLHTGQTMDTFAYGHTPEEAAAVALEKKAHIRWSMRSQTSQPSVSRSKMVH